MVVIITTTTTTTVVIVVVVNIIVEFIFERTNTKSTHYILQTLISLEEMKLYIF